MKNFFQQHELQLKKITYILGFLFILLSCAYLSFGNLGSIPIYNWDEARHGISAYEMLQNKTLLVNTFLWENDYWNLKPPLSFWPIMLAYKIFGYNAFAMRFFSALSLCIITAVSMEFMRRQFGRISALITGVLFGFVYIHCNHLFWSGDPDALYCLFLFFALLSFYLAYIKSSNWWISTGIFLALAFLTKSFHVFSFIGALFIAWLIIWRATKDNQWKNILTKALPSFLIPILIWMIARYFTDGTAFLGQMFSTDVVERVENSNPQSRGFIYYLAVSQTVLGTPFYIALGLSLALSVVFIIFYHTKFSKKDIVFSASTFCAGFFTLTFFGLARGDKSWYMWPMLLGFFPFLGWSLSKMWRVFSAEHSYKKFSAVFASAFLLFGIIAMPNLTEQQVDYDSGSLWPNRSIFYDTEGDSVFPQENKYYYSITSENIVYEPAQSWILMGYYQNFFYEKGVLEDFLQDTREDVYLLVNAETEGEILAFAENNPQIRRILNGDQCALYVKKAE